jgi:hypothetical protein
MKNKILHIIAPTFDFNTVNNHSVLLASLNQSLDCDEYHTSLADMSPTDIIKISNYFSTINYVKNGFDERTDTYKETMVLLNYLSSINCVKNFKVSPRVLFTDVDVTTRTDDPTLWVFGCSHAHGWGLLPTEKNFAQLMSESLGLPLNQITKPGSSLHWSVRHLLAANVRQDDLIVWQLTTPPRLSTYHNNQVDEVLLSHTKNKYLLEVFHNEQLFFNQITLFNFGMSYLRQIGVKFVVTSILPKQDNMYDYLNEYSKQTEYCYIPEYKIDLASDLQHVGPLSHNNIAHCLINHVQLLYNN